MNVDLLILVDLFYLKISWTKNMVIPKIQKFKNFIQNKIN